MGSGNRKTIPSPSILVLFLGLLALAFAAGGGGLGCWYLYEHGHVDGLERDEIVRGGAMVLAGTAVGCLFWALAYIVRALYRTGLEVRQLASSGRTRSERAPLVVPDRAVTAPRPSTPDEARPESSGQFDTEPVFDFELAGVASSSDPGEPDGDDDALSARREQLTAELAEQVVVAIEGPDLDEAEALLNHLAGQIGADDPHCVDLRRRLQRQRDEREFGSGEFARAPVPPIETQDRPEGDDSEGLDLEAGDEDRPEADPLDADEAVARVEQITDLMAVAKFDRAQVAARELARACPDDPDMQQLVQRVQHEAEAYHHDMRHRLKGEVQHHCDNRRWGDALASAKKLADAYPDSKEGRKIARQLKTLQANARIEQVRRLRDRMRDMLQRRRYCEAVVAAEEIMDRFPETQAAGELRKQIGRLRRLARADSSDR